MKRQRRMEKGHNEETTAVMIPSQRRKIWDTKVHTPGRDGLWEIEAEEISE